MDSAGHPIGSNGPSRADGPPSSNCTYTTYYPDLNNNIATNTLSNKGTDKLSRYFDLCEKRNQAILKTIGWTGTTFLVAIGGIFTIISIPYGCLKTVKQKSEVTHDEINAMANYLILSPFICNAVLHFTCKFGKRVCYNYKQFVSYSNDITNTLTE
jgi:hypothetical protein